MAIKGMAPNATNLLDISKASFTKAKVFNATIVPYAGHGLNFDYSAPTVYNTILDFVGSHLK